MNTDCTARVRLTETLVRAKLEAKTNGELPESWNNVAQVWSPDGYQIAFLTDEKEIGPLMEQLGYILQHGNGFRDRGGTSPDSRDVECGTRHLHTA